MRRYQSFDPNAQLNGRTVLAFIRNFNYSNMKDILKRHKLDQIDPDAWYPVQSILDVFNDLEEEANASANFVSVGIAAGELGISVTPPEQLKMTVAQFLKAYEQIYETRHRGGNSGSVETRVISDNHIMVTLRSPYPDDVYYGVIYAYVRHLCPPDHSFTVAYDETLPRRDNGGTETVIHVRLEQNQ